MNTALILFAALLLDAILGEPKWLWNRWPHPTVLMGRLVGLCDDRLNRGDDRKAKGILAIGALTVGAILFGWIISLLGGLVAIPIVAILLAQRSLVQHVGAVADGLRMSVPQGRRAVALIVSRDTTQMENSQIARSAIESGSENLSDGVIAPAFWFLVAGLPGLLVYKIVNTADSMIGYKTPRYTDFGWAAARLDDLLNLIPARLTALLVAVTSAGLTHWKAIATDAAKHRSPNAGWPEAAMARAIDVALAGPRAYDGKMQEFDWVHASGKRDIGPMQIDLAINHIWRAWGCMLGVTALFGLLIGWG